jgi:hypothetical protein
VDYPKKTGFLADLHCGSRDGLLSPRNENHTMTAGQKYLYECWMWLAKNWPPLDLLVLNGDIVDGEQYKSKHTGINTAKMGEQVQLAIEVVEDWVAVNKPKKIVRLDGTPYHEGFHGATDAFDEHFGSTWVGDILDMPLEGGALLNVKHQPEGGGGMYKGMILDREILWTVIDEKVNGAPEATHIIHAHLHCALRLDSLDKCIVLMPCFQLQTAHARKANYRRWQPMIGGVLLERDEIAENGYQVYTKKFPLPKRKIREYADLNALDPAKITDYAALQSAADAASAGGDAAGGSGSADGAANGSAVQPPEDVG